MAKMTTAIVILAIIACASAKPGLLLGEQLAYSAPIVAAAPAAVVAAPAPYVTATSSQVFARNYNGIATAPVVAAAPVAAPVVAKYVSAPLAAPVIAKYAAAPLAAPFAYSSPLTYAAAASPVCFMWESVAMRGSSISIYSHKAKAKTTNKLQLDI